MSDRIRFVDNLRTALTVLVVLHHTVCVYSGLDAWYYTEKPDSGLLSLVLTVFLMVDQAWFMGAFFLLSGLFTPMSYDRKGPRAFIRDRLLRLGVPFLVYYFLLSPLVAHGQAGSGPLWFALALLTFDLTYAAVRRSRPARRSAGPLTWPVVVGFVVVLALVTYALRMVVPIGFSIPLIDFPTGAYLPQYAAFFLAGLVAARRGWLTTPASAGVSSPAGVLPSAGVRSQVTGRAGLVLVVGGTVVFLPLALAGGTFMGGGTVGSLCYALWDSTFAVGLVLALITLFRRRFHGETGLSRLLSRHAFTVYVTHACVVTGYGYALSAVHLPTLAKVALGCALVPPACFALAVPIGRIPGVRHILGTVPPAPRSNPAALALSTNTHHPAPGSLGLASPHPAPPHPAPPRPAPHTRSRLRDSEAGTARRGYH